VERLLPCAGGRLEIPRWATSLFVGQAGRRHTQRAARPCPSPPGFTLGPDGESLASISFFWLTSEDLPDAHNPRGTRTATGKNSSSVTSRIMRKGRPPPQTARLKELMKEADPVRDPTGMTAQVPVLVQSFSSGSGFRWPGVAPPETAPSRFGADPKTIRAGTATARPHEVDNLYVVDGSFPSRPAAT